jgi:hypothetical protein
VLLQGHPRHADHHQQATAAGGQAGHHRQEAEIPLDSSQQDQCLLGGNRRHVGSRLRYVHAEIMRPTKNLDPLVETLNNLLF